MNVRHIATERHRNQLLQWKTARAWLVSFGEASRISVTIFTADTQQVRINYIHSTTKKDGEYQLDLYGVKEFRKYMRYLIVTEEKSPGEFGKLMVGDAEKELWVGVWEE